MLVSGQYYWWISQSDYSVLAAAGFADMLGELQGERDGYLFFAYSQEIEDALFESGVDVSFNGGPYIYSRWRPDIG